DLDEIEVRNWFSGIRIARRRSVPAAAMQEKPPEEPRAEAAPAAGTEAQEPETAPAAAEDDGLEQIVSPMVGTFYRSAGPGKDPFIEVGSRVETGQVLCIIEAMKLMNEIEAEHGGVIRKILVKDSQPVEFGQPLFLVESA
ncbi:MAG TPA: acetyl-CoA carboxylase biotin carboxyl carrier protein, partial [Candidatus Eisenbacteria bacterium]|nr:acetyl-CoA carboxylase biotin carboxyl carrier protein [Candidatus Eisenbacteria bacterium]